MKRIKVINQSINQYNFVNFDTESLHAKTSSRRAGLVTPPSIPFFVENVDESMVGCWPILR